MARPHDGTSTRGAGQNEKNDGAAHLEQLEEPLSSIRDSHVEDGVMVKDISAAKQADEMLKVDDERAAEIRRELAGNKQGGWRPSTIEERKMNSSLNWKLDLMVSSTSLASVLHAFALFYI
jgi:hypothetical protein